MNYEVKKIVYGTVTQTDDKKAVQIATVTSGIVGDEYGFCRWDEIKVDFEMSLTGDEIAEKISQAAAEMVKTKYPNT